MKPNSKLTKEIEDQVISYLRECGVKKISIFGSYIRGVATHINILDLDL